MKGIYIHIPFCIQKCKYCDFASYSGKEYIFDRYIDTLIKEMSLYRGLDVDTVYIGGGTPTCLDTENLKKLLLHINSIFELDPDVEFTVEANPKTVDREKAHIMKAFGVNRISLGCQSFNDKELKFLGRIHLTDDIYSTYDILRLAGFDNVNMDIMYALPGQSISDAKDSLSKALMLEPEHISCYGLKFEEGTPLFDMLQRGEISESDDDTFADMYNEICLLMKQKGYEHYEISNFAKPGFESRHNLKYWTGEQYRGFGVSAASFDGLRRYTHSPYIEDYFDGYKLCEDYTMSKEEAMREFVILGLRVIKSGVDKEIFKSKFNADFDELFRCATDKFSQYLINTPKSLKLKENACLISNSIMCEFM